MEIEVKNGAQASNICQNAKNNAINQLNTEIDELKGLVSKIKSNWQSSGMDKESYILELEKQIANLESISSLSFRFFDAIDRYVSSLVATSNNTVGNGSITTCSGNVITTCSGNVIASDFTTGHDENSGHVTSTTDYISSSGGGTTSEDKKRVDYAADKVAQTANDTAKGVNNLNSTTGNTGKGSYTTIGSGTTKSDSSSGYSDSIYSNNSIGSIDSSSGSVNSSSGNTSVPNVSDSVYNGSSSTVGTGYRPASNLSTLNSGTSNGTTSSSGNGGISSSNTAVEDKAGITSLADMTSSGTSVSTATSGMLTNGNISKIIPKMSVPSSIGSEVTSGNKTIPIVSGSLAAGAVAVGGTILLSKKKESEPTKNLEVDAWDEANEIDDYSTGSLDRKLDELTFEDTIL